jgi:hypothetical protein
MASALGQRSRAALSDTIATVSFAPRSVSVKPRPRTISMPSAPKYSGETNRNVAFDLLAPSANAGNPPTAPGHPAATAATDASPRTRSRTALRRCSFSTFTVTMSPVRIPGSTVAELSVARRKIAAQMSSSTDAVTCTVTSVPRVRLGRLPLTTSPCIARTSSRRVARSAGASAKKSVEITAPPIRNDTTRQSAGGTWRVMSPSSGGKVLVTA